MYESIMAAMEMSLRGSSFKVQTPVEMLALAADFKDGECDRSYLTLNPEPFLTTFPEFLEKMPETPWV